MSMVTDVLAVSGLLLDVFGALVMVTPDSKFLDNSVGRVFWRTRHSFNKFSEIRREHFLPIEEDKTTLPAFLVSVFDLDCEPSDITHLVKTELGEGSDFEIYWESETASGVYSTSFERAMDKVETAKRRRYLRWGAGLLVVGFGLQIVATLL